MHTPVLPENAPFTTEQRGWLNGYLAGILFRGDLETARSTASPASLSVPQKPLRILCASQSGNAEAAAWALAERLKGAAAGEGRIWAPEVTAMDHHGEVDWSEETHAVFVTSTWGDGDFPDNGRSFGAWLGTPASACLAHLRFAVLGLGDRNYARFCAAARRVDEHLSATGATRLLEVECLDADWESGAATWRERIAEIVGAGVATGGDTTPTATSAGWTKTNPFPAPLLENRHLNARDSDKDTRHVVLSLAGSGLTYRAGDALGVWPVNHFELVDSLVLACNATGSEIVRLPDGQELTFRAALLTRFDLAKPGKELLEGLAAAGPSLGDRRRLRELLEEDGTEARQELLKGSDVLDILRAFPTARIEPQSLVERLRKLAPRLYSISSSPVAHPGEVHLTVGVHQIRKDGRLRLGAASSFLAQRVPLGLPVQVFVQPSGHFHPPQDPSRDLVMVGPGTGIAPFRGFLHERAATGATGRNWLFFGDRSAETDFLYREELLDLRGRGVLHELDTAFSRDQEEKVYVQDRMIERARDLWEWLEGGAVFAVCGDAKRMAKDVDAALHKVVEIGGNRTPEQAKEYVESMRSAHRYLRDVY